MEIIDISMKISGEMMLYEGDPKVEIAAVKTFSDDGVVVSRIGMGLHSGTHVDSPAHYLEDGNSIDETDLNSLIGDAIVLDLTSVEDCITASDLKKCTIGEGEIILFKTRNSNLLKKAVFSREFIHLNDDAADYLVDKNIKAVGIDYLSIEKFNSENNYVHKRFLSKNIPVIEGLVLEAVEPGRYTLFCLPLNIVAGEAAPARCVLLR